MYLSTHARKWISYVPRSLMICYRNLANVWRAVRVEPIAFRVPQSQTHFNDSLGAYKSRLDKLFEVSCALIKTSILLTIIQFIIITKPFHESIPRGVHSTRGPFHSTFRILHTTWRDNSCAIHGTRSCISTCVTSNHSATYSLI